MTARETIDLFARIADMKDVDYRNTLAISALIELLIEKGLFTREEFQATATRLDGLSAAHEGIG